MKKIMLVILIPMVLWAWNRDIYVATHRDTIPISYDFVVPTDSEMYMVIRYVDTSRNYTKILYTTDYGAHWNILPNSFSFGGSPIIMPVNLAYYEDTLYFLKPYRTYFAFVAKAMHSDMLDLNRGYSPTNLDSMESALLTVAKGQGHPPYFYVVALGWKDTFVTYIILRSEDFGLTWHNVYTDNFSTHTEIYRHLTSFSSYDYGDSVRLIFAYTYQDTSHNTYVFMNVLTDTLGDTLVRDVGFYGIRTQTLAQVATEALSGMEVIAYTDSGKLYFKYSADNWATVKELVYPYNNNFDYIYTVDMVRWNTYIYSGLNIAYAASYMGQTYVYYQEMYATSDSIYCHNDPVLVSDTTFSTFYLNLPSYYRPRIKNFADVAGPYVLWHNDYTHSVNPYIFYDSTKFYIDYMTNNLITHSNAQKGVDTQLTLSLRDNTLYLFSPDLKGPASLTIVDITGRAITRKVVVFKEGTSLFPVYSLRKGIYFIIIRKGTTILKKKFVKLQ